MIKERLVKIFDKLYIKLKKKIKLPKIAKKHPVAFWVAVSIHVVVLIGLIFSSVPEWQPPKSKVSQKKVITKAVTVDLKSIEQEKKRLFDIEKKKEQRVKDLQKSEKKWENERYKEQQRLKKLKEQTKKTKNDINKALAKAEKEKKALEAKAKEALAKAEKEKKAIEEKSKKALAKAEKEKKAIEDQAKESLKKAEQKKKAMEAEAKEALKKAEKEKKAIEEKTKEAERIRQETIAKREKENEKFKKEQSSRELKNELQQEQDLERKLAQEDILNELKSNYINQIAARVRTEWRYQGAKDHWSCDVYILQDKNGNVQSVNLQSCDVDNSAKAISFKNSIERAVHKASPLPIAPDENVFDREVIFIFKVN